MHKKRVDTYLVSLLAVAALGLFFINTQASPVGSPDSVDASFTGFAARNVGVNQLCKIQSECQQGLVCRYSVTGNQNDPPVQREFDTTQPRVCAYPVQQGLPCESDVHCSGNLACINSRCGDAQNRIENELTDGTHCSGGDGYLVLLGRRDRKNKGMIYVYDTHKNILYTHVAFNAHLAPLGLESSGDTFISEGRGGYGCGVSGGGSSRKYFCSSLSAVSSRTSLEASIRQRMNNQFDTELLGFSSCVPCTTNPSNLGQFMHHCFEGGLMH